MNARISIPPHPKCGAPTISYVYRDENGNPVLIANRYERQHSSKFFLPFDVLRNEWKAPSIRPLYNLDKITKADPNQPIIFVEGEKCADALSELGFLTTTSFGGCNALSKTDLAPISKRHVIVWPDYDDAGEKYAKVLKDALNKIGNNKTFHVTISAEMSGNELKGHEKRTLPKGWDAADAVAEGWTKEDVERLLKSTEVQPPQKIDEQAQTQTSIDNLELWHSPDKEAFASMHTNGHVENWSLESAYFRHYLAFHHYQKEGKMLSQTALEDKRRTLAGEALFGGVEHSVFTRIGHLDDYTYLDLGDKDWTSVRIGSDGWEILKRPPIRFQRSKSMQALPFPSNWQADINLLRPFLNVGTETDFRMLVAWLLGCFHSKGPYPILILTGEQGSAKSTTAKVLRSLIDPAQPMTRSAPQSEQDLVIAARHNHVLAFDNLSHIKPALADAFCRVATGGGFGTRKLHTNTEEVLFDATRPILLNGIPDLANRPDLADRSIIVTLPVIQETERQFEADFWQRFDAVAPQILAALLDATSTALRRLPTVNLHERPRMADFARWITAAEPALGWAEGSFCDAYAENRKSVDIAALEGNPVAEAILTMIADHGPWTGTATELIDTLRKLYPQLTDDPHNFPRQPRKLSSDLKRVQPLLRRRGIVVTKERQGKSGSRQIHIKQS